MPKASLPHSPTLAVYCLFLFKGGDAKMTDIQKVRLNISDKNAEIFANEEIQSFLTDEDNSINGATAKALEIMALQQNEKGLIKSYTRDQISMSKTTLLELAQYYRKRQAEEQPKVAFFVVPQEIEVI